ncbi:hypothetical protein FB451DRAFT_1569584 [Mycena latifolia]|nr:hypothetical protein FB451DRAFT_1569584 [Mycena latifolia]
MNAKGMTGQAIVSKKPFELAATARVRKFLPIRCPPAGSMRPWPKGKEFLVDSAPGVHRGTAYPPRGDVHESRSSHMRPHHPPRRMKPARLHRILEGDPGRTHLSAVIRAPAGTAPARHPRCLPHTPHTARTRLRIMHAYSPHPHIDTPQAPRERFATHIPLSTAPGATQAIRHRERLATGVTLAPSRLHTRSALPPATLPRRHADDSPSQTTSGGADVHRCDKARAERPRSTGTHTTVSKARG